jgi:hypothetical protein
LWIRAKNSPQDKLTHSANCEKGIEDERSVWLLWGVALRKYQAPHLPTEKIQENLTL